jgi:hypothetical protein
MFEFASISVEILRDILDYDAESGALVWRMRSRRYFTSERQMNAWNAKFAGKPALRSVHSAGYLHGSIFNRMFFAHRVCWALHEGQWPRQQIDHINGRRSDNRRSNLRDATPAENSRNMAKRRRNRSGVTGVHAGQRGRWRAQITDKGRTVCLGEYDTLEAAAEARRAAERALGYHPNHGRRS